MADKLKASIKAAKHLDGMAKLEMCEVLGQFEGELQARDVVIAALKSECLRHVLYNIQRSGRGVLGDPLFALGRDVSNVSHDELKPETTDFLAGRQGSMGHKLTMRQTLVDVQKSALQKLTECLKEADSQKCFLVKEIEEQDARHRNELAQASASSAQITSSDATSSRTEDDASIGGSFDIGDLKQLRKELQAEKEEKYKLQSSLDSLAEKLTEEQVSKKQITLLLLDDQKKVTSLYLEEKKRSEDLSQLLREEKAKLQTLGTGLEEESERSLAMETELEKHLLQINSHREELAGMRTLHKELEEALRRARADADHFKKQLTEAHRVAMSQASVAASVAAAVVNNPMVFAGDPAASPSNVGAGKVSQSSMIYGMQAGDVNCAVTMPSSFERDSLVKSGLKSKSTEHQASTGTIISRQHRGGILNSSTNDNASNQSTMTTSSKLVHSSGDFSSNALPFLSSRLVGLSSSPSPSTKTSSSGGLAKVMSHVIVGNKASSSSSTGAGKLGKGVPPPLPPNKPSMSALYKPFTAALKLGGGGGGGSVRSDNAFPFAGNDVGKSN